MKQLFAIIIVIVFIFGTYTKTASAITHYGGPIGVIHGCFNTVIYTVLGAPRGGPFIWSPTVTRTYAFGPPSHSGQYLLGNAGPSYFCVQSILPIIVQAGLLELMNGSSQ
jgi:hypothetical protein